MLIKKHYMVVIRTSKGSDILAACGQLSGLMKSYVKYNLVKYPYVGKRR